MTKCHKHSELTASTSALILLYFILALLQRVFASSTYNRDDPVNTNISLFPYVGDIKIYCGVLAFLYSGSDRHFNPLPANVENMVSSK
jgi:hypothetical protein